ncbi:hypothetical protein [Rathayibacter sp. VKM Ac-2630]|uniref:hypothetical protein n=1 Tax=Rathayibacter sp. VKM Ac-2630 TaxID=1938617 RepID=UPI00098199F3|nr:hypothetical protein [Rathayibacter sp. VKM Ac-2630]OOB90897.1 hypothetical protein B0T42_09150 [Rathayibacter sp. VKM Ac-2630]
MFLFLILQFAPAAGGLLLAGAWWWLRRRSEPGLPAPVRAATAVGAVLALASALALTAVSVFPEWLPPFDQEGHLRWLLARYLIPLIVTFVALVLLQLPRARARGAGTAELAPRTLLTFAPRPLLVATATAALAAVAAAVLAGAAASTDELGRSVRFVLPVSENTYASSTFYGWWFSVPCLVLLALVLVVAGLALRSISRPPLDVDRSADAAERTIRARNVLAVVIGGVLLHVGAVFSALRATSMLQTGFDAGATGFVQFGTSFAALGSALLVAGWAATLLGSAFWWGVLLSTLRSTSRRPVGSVAR